MTITLSTHHRRAGRRSLRTALVLALTLLVAAPTTPAGAGASRARVPVAEGPWAQLQSRAEASGLVPVIVRLRADSVQTSSGLSRRQAIVRAQASLLSELRGSRKVKAFSAAPLIALHATPETLADLRRSDAVAAVARDRVINVDLPAPRNPRPLSEAPRIQATPGTSRPDRIAQPQGTSSNTRLRPWWDVNRIRLRPALRRGFNGRGQTVAVLDTGVQAGHPWMRGKVVAEACFATRTHGSAAGDCPNGGWWQLGPGAAAPCTYSALCAHGTHVAHTAVGRRGVARGARLIALQVFHNHAGSGTPLVYDSDLLWGLDYVYNLRRSFRIAAVNLSLGGGRFSRSCDSGSLDGTVMPGALHAYFQALRSAGVATVVASGNANYSDAMGSPACKSNAISVGNTTLTRRGRDAVFGGVPTGSNSARMLKLLAPGTRICSAVPVNRYDCTYIGTSMAAPHVSGAIAILKQARRRASVTTSLRVLQTTGHRVRDSRNGLVRPRIDVWRAVSRLRR